MAVSIEQACGLLHGARRLAASTGAGISTESGIPDFRGPPIEYRDFLADPEARREYWRRKVEAYPGIRDARPNRGHLALARLHRAGMLRAAAAAANLEEGTHVQQ